MTIQSVTIPAFVIRLAGELLAIFFAALAALATWKRAARLARYAADDLLDSKPHTLREFLQGLAIHAFLFACGYLFWRFWK